MFGNDIILCKAEGTWTTTPKCLRQCTSPAIPNGNTFPYKPSYISNSTVNMTCDDNAHMKGGGNFTCVNGTWIGNTVNCEVFSCRVPLSIPIHSVLNSTEYLVDHEYSLYCEEGYDGDVTAFCGSGGIWNINGSCSAVVCPAPIQIPNSNSSIYKPVHFGWSDTFTYRFV